MDTNKYFAELGRRLTQQGLQTRQQPRVLEVLLDGLPACAVSPDGAVWRRPQDLDTEAAHAVYHLAAAEARQVHEYMNAIEYAPPLAASGLEEGYKMLADFNGHVLAARGSPRGPEFVTWQWSYERSYLTLGHYCGDNYQGAKQDFACRAGLVDPNRIFSDKQLIDLYNQLSYSLDEGMVEFGPAAEKQLQGVLDQIKNVLPELNGQYAQQSEQELKREISMKMR